ncbi:MAG TPA: 3'-5' exonuclease [Lachnospiraceae bacterium]|nr:3'-5' exonuclease [Lachnospiraceae bacterium]HPF29988.1 3'-5' exonuclease [Lachnospiraceae bacterium]
MNYIVFDLEWNQPADGKSSAERELLFEIIEIGAVKLDSHRKIIGKFNELICPQVYHQINWRTKKMLNLQRGELEQGDRFPNVMQRFLKWCGSDYVFCSWGPQDLTELQRNMHYYHMTSLSDRPIPFYNIQKLFGIQIHEEDCVKNLEAAVDLTGMDKDIPFHRAYSDAYYTAKIFAKMPEDIAKNNISYDLFHLPRCREEEIRINNEHENMYISRGFTERSEILENRAIMAINCAKCGQKPVRARIRWFTTNNKIYYSAGFCEHHGLIRGKLRIKKNDFGELYAEKQFNYTTEEEVAALKEKKKSSGAAKKKAAENATEKKTVEMKPLKIHKKRPGRMMKE